jgi:tagatose 1,6-diphosphate aldolase
VPAFVTSKESSTLPPGKIRALQTLSTEGGIFMILAADHRDSMRALINAEDPASVPAARLTELKLALAKHVAPRASGIMLDPVYGAPQAIVDGALPGNIGFLSALEEQGYLGDPRSRQTTLLSGWSVSKAKRLGASGIKLLLFYHHDAGEATDRQEQTVRDVIKDCARYEIPLFLEPMAYSPDSRVPQDSREFALQRRSIVIESAKRLGALGPDVLKMQFPIDAQHDQDEYIWKDACEELNSAAPVPWALLSGGDPYDTFKTQLRIACEAGCSGFMAGRALWIEMMSVQESERRKVIDDVILPRFDELSDVAATYGHGWQEKCRMPTVDDAWYRQY